MGRRWGGGVAKLELCVYVWGVYELGGWVIAILSIASLRGDDMRVHRKTFIFPTSSGKGENVNV